MAETCCCSTENQHAASLGDKAAAEDTKWLVYGRARSGKLTQTQTAAGSHPQQTDGDQVKGPSEAYWWILFGIKTKVPLNDIRDLSVGDVEEPCGGENCSTHQLCIFTMKAGRFLK